MSRSKSHHMHTLAVATALILGSAVAAPAFAGKMSTTGLQSQQLHDRFIVKYKAGTAAAASANVMNQMLARAADASGLRKSRGLSVTRLRHIATGAEVVKTSRKLDRVDAESLMRRIAADPSVDYVEVDRILVPTLTPNDPIYPQQWGYQDDDAGIRANTAWDIANGAGIVVAVLDTGITNHSDLNSNILPGYDFIGDLLVANDGDGRDADAADPGDWNSDANVCSTRNSSWHGTHVTGTVAALTNNAVGVAGTAWGSKVMPVRVLGRCGGYTSDIADGIIWASGGAVMGVPNTTTPAHVINMSLGGGGACGTTTQNAINSAVSRGTTIVVAAGNSNADAANYTPASCNNVITVASITSASARSSFSNFGAKIDVSAPGSTIASTLNTGTTTPLAEAYANYNGTSMASPHVAGAVALVQSRRLALGLALFTPAEMEALLKTTAYPLAVACTQGCGAGIIDARSAVDGAGEAPPDIVTTYTNATDVGINDSSSWSSRLTVSGRTGLAPSATPVSVDIRDTATGNLRIDLVAPDGSVYLLQSSSPMSSTGSVIRTYTVNLSSESINGSWRIRVSDNDNGNSGYINSWSIRM